MKIKRKIDFEIFNHLSLDIALGSVISSLFLSFFLKVQPNENSLILLALTVWCIYTLDHLLDSLKGPLHTLSQRHQFHKQHFNQLGRILIVVLLLIGILLFFIPKTTLLAGTVLSSFLLAYLLSVHLLKHKFIIHKEFVIALIYTAGICIGPISQMKEPLIQNQYLVISTFFTIVLFNLLLFSLMDKKNDKSANFPSIVTSLGDKTTHLILKTLGFLEVVLLIVILQKGLVKETVLMACMFGVLQIIYRLRHKQFVITYYRQAGDGIFLLPILYLL